MWVLDFIPDAILASFVYGILIIGIGLYVLGMFSKLFKPIAAYGFFIRNAGIIMTVAGVWFLGQYNTELKWRNRVAELEAKVQVAEAKSREVNTVIETKVIEKIKVVKENTDANVKIIKEIVAVQLDADCKLPESAVLLHNSASQNEVAGSAINVDGRTSDVKASELLTTTTENYGTYYQIVEKLKGWQTWYKEQKKIHEETFQ